MSEASSLLVYSNMLCVVYNMHYIIQFFFVICYILFYCMKPYKIKGLKCALYSIKCEVCCIRHIIVLY